MAQKVKVLIIRFEDLNSWNPHGERKESGPTSCPLTSTSTSPNTHTKKHLKKVLTN